jgi:polysaccharide export outer membrane protein
MAIKVMELATKRKILFLGMLTLISGCAIAPGMKMNNQPSSSSSISAQQIQPNFIEITPQLVSSIHQNTNYSPGYLIGSQDVLNIVVWQHPELNYPLDTGVTQSGQNTEMNPTMSPNGFLVAPDGTIFFPLVGRVHIAGMTVDQVRIKITQLLTKYVREPQVDVRVTGFRHQKVYVMGEVLKPGLQPITDVPLSITDAINLSGGLDPLNSDPAHIYVIRGSMTRPDVYWLDAKSPEAMLLAENFTLQSHDIIFVSAADIARWNRGMNMILPTIQTLWFTGSIIKGDY